MAELGLGSGVFYGASTPTTQIPNCKSITLPSLVFAEVDTSNLSTGGNVCTYIPAPLAKPQKMTVECQYSHTSSVALLAIEGVMQVWKVVLAGSSASKWYEFAGFITQIDRKVTGHDEIDMMTVSVQMSGGLTALDPP